MSKTIIVTGASALLAVALAAWVAAAQPEGTGSPGIEQRLSAARARVATAEQQLQRGDDERAIENLQSIYGFFVDKALWKETADLFTDDAALEVGGRGVFVGKAHILQYLTSIAPQGLTRGTLPIHIQLQPIFTVAADGGSALGRARFLAQIAVPDKSMYFWSIGTYENEYVKQNGVWKIKTLHAYLRMWTPYESGWAKVAGRNTEPNKDLPSDRPPTVSYQAYPATYIPPYHYPNPVTGPDPVTGPSPVTGK